jgi:hypothetical protein
MPKKVPIDADAASTPNARERLLIDTFYVQAVFNPNDSYHDRAVALAPPAN